MGPCEDLVGLFVRSVATIALEIAAEVALQDPEH